MTHGGPVATAAGTPVSGPSAGRFRCNEPVATTGPRLRSYWHTRKISLRRTEAS